MKKVLIVTELFHPSIGGMETRYKELGKVFIQNGWAVHVATIGLDAHAPAEECIDGLLVHRLISTATYRRPNARLRRSPSAILRFASKVRRHVRTYRYDLIIFSIWPILPQICTAVPKGTVALMDWCEHRSNGIWPLINRILAGSTKKHISVSEGVRDILVRRYGIADIVCIPSGIFSKDFRSAQHRTGILFFGRLSPHKRPEEAIESVIRARQMGFTEHLTVAGGGPQAEYLKQRYGHLDFVHMPGQISDEQKITLFAQHRLYLLPSTREGFPVAVAEAMASGTPTITTNHQDNGTVAIMRQYSCGIVVEPGAEAIARAICRLTTNSAEWERLSQSGLDASRTLDWQYVFGKLLAHAGIR